MDNQLPRLGYRGCYAASSFVFEMPIEDALSFPDGTVVVTGCISAGEVRPGDNLELRTPVECFTVQVVSLEVFGKLNVAIAGDNIGVRLSGITKDAVCPGSRLMSA